MVQRAFIGVIIQDVTQDVMNELELPNTRIVFQYKIYSIGIPQQVLYLKKLGTP